MPPVRALCAALAVCAAVALSGCNLNPPDTSFRVSYLHGDHPGDVLTFAMTAACLNSQPTTAAWDLDGDGEFEPMPTEPCTNRSREYSYSRPGTYTVSVWASLTFKGLFTTLPLEGYSSVPVTITAPPQAGNQPPAASFTTDANPGYTERPVHFDASGSSDSDGRIVNYEWDFTSDGTWDATGPTASYAYQSAGDYRATLRVTDDRGATATTTRAVPVVDGVPPSQALASTGIASAARATRFSSTLSGRVTSRGSAYINGGTLANIGLSARGSMKLKGLPKPLERKHRARWKARFTTRQHGSNASAKLAADGVLLLDFGHRDRVCFSGRVGGRLDGRFKGRVAVVGGTGLGRHVRGSASFLVPQKGRTLKGQLNLARGRKARRLPKACHPLARP